MTYSRNSVQVAINIHARSAPTKNPPPTPNLVAKAIRERAKTDADLILAEAWEHCDPTFGRDAMQIFIGQYLDRMLHDAD